MTLQQEACGAHLAHGLSAYMRAQACSCMSSKGEALRMVIRDALVQYQQQCLQQSHWKSRSNLQLLERPLVLIDEQCLYGLDLAELYEFHDQVHIVLLSSVLLRELQDAQSLFHQSCIQASRALFSEDLETKQEFDTLSAEEILHSSALMMVSSFSLSTMSYLPLKEYVKLTKHSSLRVAVDNSLSAAFSYKPLAKHADYLIEEYSDDYEEDTRFVLVAYKQGCAQVQNAVEKTRLAQLYRCMKQEFFVLSEAQDNAETLARYLAAHPLCVKLRYPHHPEDPAFALCAQQYDHKGGRLIYAELALGDASEDFVSSLKSCVLAYKDLCSQEFDVVYQQLIWAKSQVYTQFLKVSPKLMYKENQTTETLSSQVHAYYIVVGAEHIHDLLEMFEAILQI